MGKEKDKKARRRAAAADKVLGAEYMHKHKKGVRKALNERHDEKSGCLPVIIGGVVLTGAILWSVSEARAGERPAQPEISTNPAATEVTHVPSPPRSGVLVDFSNVHPTLPVNKPGGVR